MNGKRLLASLMTITMTIGSFPAGVVLNSNSNIRTVRAEETTDISTNISTAEALAAAKKEAEEKESELNAAKALVVQYEAAVLADNEALKKAEAEKLSAETALEASTKTLNDASTDLEKTQNTYDNIDSLIETAKADKADADDDVTTAQGIYDSKKADADKADEEYTKASDKLVELKTTKDEADEKKATLKTAYETSKSNYDTLKEDTDEKKAALDSAKEELNEAKDNLTEAETSYETAKTDYADKNAKAIELKTAYDTALSRKEKGTYGFFESRNDTAAMSALTTCKYKDYIKLGAADDATSLDNMALTFDHMRNLNTIRKNVGLKELKVTSTLMAQAQADADYSDTIVAHAQQFNVGENIAWNSKNADPYIQWYTNEKSYFDEAAASLGQTTELTGEAAYNYYNNGSNKTLIDTYVKDKHGSSKSVGHYTNDINPSYTITGFAITDRSTMYPCTYLQVFYFSSSETSYTVDEYEELFNEYKEGIDKAITDYNDAVTARDTAYVAMNSADDARESAETVVTTKQAAYDTAEETYNTARTKSEQTYTTMQAAKIDYDDSIEEATAADEAYTAQRTITADRKTSLDTANSILTKAGEELEGAKTAQTAAAENLSSLQYLAENKEQVLQEKVTAVNTAEADKAAKEQTVQTATVKYNEAQEKAATSQNALTSAKAEVTAATTAYNAALEAVESAQTAYDTEQEAIAREEAARLEAEKQEEARKEAERLEAEKQEEARKEAERLEAEKQEEARKEAERLEAEKQEEARKEAERLEIEKQQTATQQQTQTPADNDDYADLTADDDEETIFVSGTATYEVTDEDGEVEYVKLNKKKATYAVIPATVKYNGVTYKVTSVGSKAFYNCKQLKTVTVGTNVESIGSKAFYNTKKLTKITIKTKKLTADEVSSTAFKRAGKSLGKKLVIKVPASKKKQYKKIIKNGGFKIR